MASYPRSEAGSAAPPPVPTPVRCWLAPNKHALTAQSHQSEAEVALATSKKQLHAVTPHPPTPQPVVAPEPASEVRPTNDFR